MTVIRRDLSRVSPLFSPYDSWERLQQTPVNLSSGKQRVYMNGRIKNKQTTKTTEYRAFLV